MSDVGEGGGGVGGEVVRVRLSEGGGEGRGMEGERE